VVKAVRDRDIDRHKGGERQGYRQTQRR